MDKQKVVHTHNRLLFSLIQEGNSDTCYHTDEPEDVTLSDISQAHKKRQILYASAYVGALKNTQIHRDRKQKSGLREQGAEEARMGVKIQLCKRRVLPMDGCDDSTTTWMDFMTMNFSA